MLEVALEVVDRGCPLPVLASETELPVIVEGQEHKDASSHGRMQDLRNSSHLVRFHVKQHRSHPPSPSRPKGRAVTP